MGEQHQLTPKQLKRVSAFEVEILPDRLRKKKFAQRLEELEHLFDPALRILLTTRPTRSVGTWRLPTDSETTRAIRLMLARLIIYARHDRGKAGSAQSARIRLHRLTASLGKSKDALKLDRFARRYIRECDPDLHSKLDDLAAELGRVSETVGHLAAEFPVAAKRGITPSAQGAADLLLMLYIQATGVYPALSSTTAWLVGVVREPRSFVLVAPPSTDQAAWPHQTSPPLVRIAQCAVDAATRGVAKYKTRASKLNTHLFETRATRMRERTLISSS